MREELIAELSEKELRPPAFYPIEYALMWVAYGNKPINLDYAKIIYDTPPKFISNEVLKNAEKKLIMYLRSGKISSKAMDYKKDKKGEYIKTGKGYSVNREMWGNKFDWVGLTLPYINKKDEHFEHTDILLKTSDLLKCTPIESVVVSKKLIKKSVFKKDIISREKETLLKLLLGLALTNYEYNPLVMRNATAREISDDLLLHGLSVDQDTVKKWLDEAKQLLPQDWKAKK